MPANLPATVLQQAATSDGVAHTELTSSLRQSKGAATQQGGVPWKGGDSGRGEYRGGALGMEELMCEQKRTKKGDPAQEGHRFEAG
eukprot:1160963-Pelagomonas_calceolata.AAC.7